MKLLLSIRNWVWGIPMLTAILCCGLYLSFLTGWVQIRKFPEAMGRFFRKIGKTGNRELCTALASTVGTGNIVGVAGALCMGGPGAVFWMWVSAFLGMAVKFSEVTLAVSYRVPHADGYRGGPMYMISQGMGARFAPLAGAYCVFGIFACLGMGTSAQISAVLESVSGSLDALGLGHTRLGSALLGCALALITLYTMLGGGKRIGDFAQMLVPVGCVLYIMLCACVLFICRKGIPGAFSAIFTGAFSPRAVTGGMVGSAFAALSSGCCRGIFSNEAGMGTASIAHATAPVKNPAEQGLMGIVEVFLDTIVICTLTALTILSSGIPIPYGSSSGSNLTGSAMMSVMGNVSGLLLSGCLVLFAYATVLGWGLYGLRCWEYLFGENRRTPFLLLQIATVALTGLFRPEGVWLVCEIVNALMAVPNLAALVYLSNRLKRCAQVI